MFEPTPFNLHIGGVFLYSENPQALSDWYRQLFRLPVTEGADGELCHILPYNETDAPGQMRYVVWAIMRSKDALPPAQPKRLMVNYRVNNLEAFVQHAHTLGLTPDAIETHPQGYFTWLTDPDGNRLEIWQDTPTE